LVRRCEWDTEKPKPGFLPQISHLAATMKLLKAWIGSARQRGRNPDSLAYDAPPPNWPAA
jgi:hypothetical protein